MKKQWPIILLGIITVLVLVPLGIAFMLSFRFIETDTTNEWIGFWGGYLGSILGGIITLLVMYFTLKNNEKNLRTTLNFEKQKMLNEQKTRFNDELLKELVEFHTIVEKMENSYKTVLISSEYSKESMDKLLDDFPKLVTLCKLIVIKLSAKKSDDKYKDAALLAQSAENLIDAVKMLISIDTNEIEEFKRKSLNAIDDIRENREKLIDDLEIYYVKNTVK